MSRDPKEERLNWGLDWSDYLTSQRDFIVGRLEEHLDSDQVAFEEQEELGQATVARAHAVLRFSPHLYEDCKNDNAQASLWSELCGLEKAWSGWEWCWRIPCHKVTSINSLCETYDFLSLLY